MRGRGKKAKTPRSTPSAQLCWRCQNAVPNRTGRGCNWSIKFEPVEGWTATETERDGLKGYCITACPEFVPDEEKPTHKELERVSGHSKYFEWYCKKNGVTAEQYAANIDKLPADERALLHEICENGTPQKKYARKHCRTQPSVARQIQKAFALLREYTQQDKGCTEKRI